MGWGGGTWELTHGGWAEVGARHSGSTHRGWAGVKTGLRPPVCWTGRGEDVLGWVWAAASLEGSGCILSLGNTWKCIHAGDLSSSHNSSTSPGGRAGSCFNTCRTSLGVHAGADQEVTPDLERCPPPAVITSSSRSSRSSEARTQLCSIS